MTEKKEDVKKLIMYLAITFAATYAVEICACLFLKDLIQIILVLVGVMFIPMIVTLIVCRGLTPKRSGVLWKPDFKKSIGWLLLAWFLPALMTAAGAAVYFAVFPKNFSSELYGLSAMLTQQGMEIKDGTFNGAPLDIIAISQAVSSVIIAPFINAIPALGEEIGWRGFMTPAFTRLWGRRPALIVSGVIWGLWHAPLIVLIDYEYSGEYVGKPWTGVALFCLITCCLGVILSFLYDKTKSIIAPALMHGAFNAIAALPLYFLSDLNVNMLLGPAPNGLIAAIPMLILTAVLLFAVKEPQIKNDENKTEEQIEEQPV